MKAQNINKKNEPLKLQGNGIVRFASSSEIVYLKADDNYTLLVLNDGSTFTVCKTLLIFEIVLGFQFFRCHKSFLINNIYIKEMNKRSHHIILTIGEKIPYSKKKSKQIEEMMQNKDLARFASLTP